jgi:hypothetical protein
VTELGSGALGDVQSSPVQYLLLSFNLALERSF